MARCHAEVLATLLGRGVLDGSSGKLHALVGASLGGMQALQFASLYPSASQRLLAVATTGRTTPFSVAIRSTQRAAILSDPLWLGGNYEDDATKRVPAAGLRLARELGTMFYRSRAEFDGRFEWSPGSSVDWTKRETWEVESYLHHAGSKFVRAFDANGYLLLSKAMDLMDLGDGVEGRSHYAEGARRIASRGCKTLLVGIRQDALVPAAELAALAGAINSSSSSSSSGPQAAQVGGAPPPAAEFLELDSDLGHDAFLVPRALPLLQTRTSSRGWAGGHSRGGKSAGGRPHVLAQALRAKENTHIYIFNKLKRTRCTLLQEGQLPAL
jgi:homoserine O-acetyltransferase